MLACTISPIARQALLRPTVATARLAPATAPAYRTASALPSRSYASAPSGSEGPSSWPPLPAGFEKLAGRPSAVEAIRNLVRVMKNKGLDLTSGEKPSIIQLMKLAANSDIREASGKVMHELKEAGIEVSPETMQKLMNSPTDFLKDPKK